MTLVYMGEGGELIDPHPDGDMQEMGMRLVSMFFRMLLGGYKFYPYLKCPAYPHHTNIENLNLTL